jgi:enoyl-CoA hydratase
MELILTGVHFLRLKGSSWIVNKVVPPESVLDEAIKVASQIAVESPIAVILAKEAVLKAFDASLNEGLQFERKNFVMVSASEDQKEGMTAFLEKCEPQFIGK